MKPRLPSWRDVLSGAAGGVAATATMSAAMAGAKAAGLLGEPPPHRIVRKLAKRATTALGAPRSFTVPAAWIAHFGFGAVLGAIHSVMLGEKRTSIPAGVLFGAGVWTLSYLGVLPALGLMPRPKHDKLGRPTSMLIAHLVFGATLAASARAGALDTSLDDLAADTGRGAVIERIGNHFLAWGEPIGTYERR